MTLRTWGRALISGVADTPSLKKIARSIVPSRLLDRAVGPDAFLLSFPKCGRTWLRLMVGRAMEREFGLDTGNPMELRRLGLLHPSIPSVSVQHDGNPHKKRPDQLERDKSRYTDRPVILLVRDPRDVVVSWYFHRTRREGGYVGSVGSFLREEVGGLESILGYYRIWADVWPSVPSGLLIRYEDLIDSPETGLHRVLQFLVPGHPWPHAGVRDVVASTSFDRMRAMERTDELGSGRLRRVSQSDPESYKVRRGKVGGYLDYLTEEDVQYLEERVAALVPPAFGYTDPPVPREA